MLARAPIAIKTTFNSNNMRLIFLIAFVACAMLTRAQSLSDGEYLIKINDTGKYLAIAGANKDNGAWMIQWDNEYTSHFRFILKHLGNNVYSIKAKHSGRYLSTEGEPRAGAKIIQWDWLNQDNQKWYIQAQPGSKGYVISSYQNKMKIVLQYWNSTVTPQNGAYFFLQGDMNMRAMVLDFKKNETDQIEDNQLKRVGKKQVTTSSLPTTSSKILTDIADGIYKIRINETGKYLAIAGQEDMNDGMRLIQWEMLPRNNHLFAVKKLDNGSFSIRPVHSEKELDVVDMRTEDGTQVQQWQGTGTSNQQWRFFTAPNGVYITSIASGKRLQLSGSATNNSDGVPLIINSASSQSFTFLPARPQKFTDVITIRDLHFTVPKLGGDQQIFGNITVDIVNKYGQSKGSYYFSEKNDLYYKQEEQEFDIGKTGILKVPGEFKFKMPSEELIGAKMIVTYGMNENDASVFTTFGGSRGVSTNPEDVWQPDTKPFVGGGADDFYLLKNSFNDCLKSKLSPGKYSNSQTFFISDIPSMPCQVHVNMQDEDGSDNWLDVYFIIKKERKL